MRPLTMSGHFLLAPIPESSSDYLLPKDIKLAVLGARSEEHTSELQSLS